MPRNFDDWYTEEDDIWDEERSPSQRRTASSRRHWLLYTLVGVLIMSGAGFILYQWTTKQVSTTETTVTADILAVHDLIWRANDGGDAELLPAVLSGSDMAWNETLQSLTADSHLWDRTPFGFRTDSTAVPPPAEVRVSPNWQAAEVSFSLPYLTANGEMVSFRQTTVYRRGSNRWLYAPPASDFWGEWMRSEGEHLTLTYPARDQDIAEALAPDLDAFLGELCHTVFDINCPPHMQVRVRLSEDARSLANTFDLANFVSGNRQVELPTPTLVGIPEDETGYQALYRGYAAFVATAVIADLTNYQCCDQALFFRALLDYQLNELGVRSWPLSPVDYEHLLQENVDVDQVIYFWNAQDLNQDSGGWEWVYAFLAYVLDEAPSTVTPTAMLRAMDQSSYAEWFHMFGVRLSLVQREWVAYLYHHAASGLQTEPPLPLPRDALGMTCEQANGVAVFDYDFTEQAWTAVFSRASDANTYTAISPLAQPDSYLVQQTYFTHDAIAMTTTLHVQGVESTVFGDGQIQTFWVDTDPTGQYLLFNSFENRATFASASYELLDLQTCNGGRCLTTSLLDYPIWSPDGQHMIMLNWSEDQADWREMGFLYTSDAQGQVLQPVGEGKRPSWLDSQTYAYVHDLDDGEQEVLTAVVGENNPRLWFRLSDLVAVLPSLNNATLSADTHILQILPIPTGENEVVVLLSPDKYDTSPGSHRYLVQVQRGKNDLNEITFLTQVNEPVDSTFSPDGRWLLMMSYAQFSDNARALLRLLDMETQQITVLSIGEPYWSTDWWSSDGNWIFQGENGYLLLYAPAYNYHYFIPYDMQECQRIFWHAP